MSDDFVRLPPRARWRFHISALVQLVAFWSPVCLVGAVILATQLHAATAAAVAGVVWLLAFLWSIWAPSLAFDAWGYLLGERELLVRSGFLVRNLAAIPVGRIQFVDLQQGLVDQWFGLATIRVHTASGLGADAVIPGMDLDDAETLRQALVARAEGDDGV